MLEAPKHSYDSGKVEVVGVDSGVCHVTSRIGPKDTTCPWSLTIYRAVLEANGCTVSELSTLSLIQLILFEIAVVKKKIESLRGSRRREKNRARRSKRTYKGRTNSYTPKWFAWDALKFLDRSVSNNSEEEVIDEDPIEQVRKTNDMVNKKIVSRKRRSCPEDPRIKEPCSMLQSTVKIEDECSMFGEYIAEKLRKHDSRTRMILQHQIHNVLYEAEMNKEPIVPIKNSSL
ncbi:hypothetical protein CBL_06704 [Carabus blaptoides fortunei]